jgi:hypothetical protein
VSGDSRADLGERSGGWNGRGADAQGARDIAAILPNGRTVWLRVDRPLAPAATADRLAQTVEHRARWGRAAARAQSEAIARLARTVAEGADRLEQERVDRRRALRRRVFVGDDTVDRKLAKAAAEHRTRIEKQMRIERENVRRLERRDLWNKILIASAFPLFAAFGQPGNPFGANNLTLLVSLLIWMVGDEIVDALFGNTQESPYLVRDADAWTYIAPIGNLLAGWWLLGDQQHERFVANHTSIPADSFEAEPNSGVPGEFIYRYSVTFKLTDFIAPSHFPDFETFKGVPVVASIESIRFLATAGSARVDALTARVHDGKLTITVTVLAPDPGTPPTDPIPTVIETLDVAWMVDTAKPPASNPET